MQQRDQRPEARENSGEATPVGSGASLDEAIRRPPDGRATNPGSSDSDTAAFKSEVNGTGSSDPLQL